MQYVQRTRVQSFARNRAIVTGVLFALGLATAACDDDDNVTAPTDNRPPTAIIAADLLEIPAGDANSTIVTINGMDSTDPDGNTLTFSWSVPGGTFENGTTASSSFIQVSFPGTGSSTVTLVVSDGAGGSDSAQITIGLEAAAKNQPPVAAFTVSPATVPLGDANMTLITLDARETFDPEGGSVEFTWSVPGGTFEGGTDSASQVAQITLPGTVAVTVDLTVTDEEGLIDTASFTIQLR